MSNVCLHGQLITEHGHPTSVIEIAVFVNICQHGISILALKENSLEQKNFERETKLISFLKPCPMTNILISILKPHLNLWQTNISGGCHTYRNANLD